MTILQKQSLLVYLGCLKPQDVDGIWGEKSVCATKAAQKMLGLTSDGIWGTQTDGGIRKAVYQPDDTLPEKAEEKPSFWDHIRYWSREEFRCRCGDYHEPYCDGYPAEPDQTLVELVDDIRHDLGAPGLRSSGLRCRQHNADSGGVANSRHLTGKALDFMIEGISAQRVCDRALADSRTNYAYIIGPGPYVHVDVK